MVLECEYYSEKVLANTLLIQRTVESRYLEVDRTIFYKFKLPEVQIPHNVGCLPLALFIVTIANARHHAFSKNLKCLPENVILKECNRYFPIGI